MSLDYGSDERIELLDILQGHDDRVWFVSWKPLDPSCLASCSGDKTVRLWNNSGSKKWKCTHILDGAHSRTVRSVSFSPKDNLIASSGFDSSTAIWELEFNHQYGCIANLEGHDSEVKSVAFSSSGSLLATCSRDKSVWIWEVSPDGTFECLSVLQEHTQDIKMVTWHPQLDLLASASYDDTIKIWREDEDDWACVATLEGHESTVWAVDFNKPGTHLVSASDDLKIKFWHRAAVGPSHEQWNCVQTISNCFDRTIYSISWCKDDIYGPVVTGSGDNIIRIFEPSQVSNPEGEMPSYKLSSSINGAHGASDINTVAWQSTNTNDSIKSTGVVFASGGDDNIIRIWLYKRL